MKYSFICWLFFFFIPAAYGQFPVPPDSLYSLLKSNSIHRNNVDWAAVDATFQKNIKQAGSLNDTMKCFVSVLESLNDVHTQIYLNNKYYGNYPDFEDSTLTWLVPLNDKATALTNKIRTQLLPDNIAYVRVPGFQVYDKNEINRIAQALHDSINKFGSEKIKGFIIDLRLNGGGNIYPMLSGLSAFLGDSIIAFETDINDSIVRAWKIKSGNFIIGGYQTTEISRELNSGFLNLPVVVLTGPVTKSSGSMTAIAFKERPHTIFIGEPTADGYTTSNGFFQLSPGLTLNFATNFVADRKKKIYKTTVDPEIFIYHGDDFENLLNDGKIKAAISWFNSR